jgi:nucleotide-binding universal stress UspA family protein
VQTTLLIALLQRGNAGEVGVDALDLPKTERGYVTLPSDSPAFRCGASAGVLAATFSVDSDVMSERWPKAYGLPSGRPPDLLRLARRRSAGRRMSCGPWLRENSDMTDAPILICFDGSDDADRAIATAATILGSRRAVVLDIAPPLTGAESVAAVSSVVPGNAFEDLNTAEAGRVASQGADIARSAGFDAQARSALAAPTWEGIVDVADELDAPLIVIGSRGLKGLREILEGSLSHQLAEHAGRPVLIAPPPHDER